MVSKAQQERSAEEVRRILDALTLSASQKSGEPTGPAAKADRGDFIRNFHTRPKELIALLEEEIIGQRDAIRILSTKICGHYNTIRSRLERGEDPMKDVNRIKSNILLIGSTGVGKTLLIKTIAQNLGVPFHRVDATKFTEAGYVGGDVEDIIRDLVKKTKGADGKPNLGLAQYGIIFIDEVDKIASSAHSYGPDVSRRGVQQALLTLIEDADVALDQKFNFVEQIKIARDMADGKAEPPARVNTKHMLFVFSGAFPGIEEIIAKRINIKTLGFAADIKDAKQRDQEKPLLLKKLCTDDLTRYGMEAELIGRIPVRVSLDNLSVDDLYQIIRNPNSPIIGQFKEVMRAYGTKVDFTDEVFRYLAEQTGNEKTGARSLATVFEKALGVYENRLSSMGIESITFTLNMIDGTIDPLILLGDLETGLKTRVENLQEELEKRQRREKQIEGYAALIKEKHGIDLTFTDQARWLVEGQAKKEDKTPCGICILIFTEYEAAFGQLAHRGITQLTITDRAIIEPVKFLEAAFKK
jgi:endopeptidase Clp ATP-binding regulatory subunit ClpX